MIKTRSFAKNGESVYEIPEHEIKEYDNNFKFITQSENAPNKKSIRNWIFEECRNSIDMRRKFK